MTDISRAGFCLSSGRTQRCVKPHRNQSPNSKRFEILALLFDWISLDNLKTQFKSQVVPVYNSTTSERREASVTDGPRAAALYIDVSFTRLKIKIHIGAAPSLQNKHKGAKIPVVQT